MDIWVQVTSNADSAVSGEDFEPVDTIVFIPAGQSEAQFDLTILDDNVYEGNEQFTVRLSTPSNATIADGVGIIEILDDDDAPEISLTDVVVDEQNTTLDYSITFNQTLSAPVRVTLSTELKSRTATPTQDYTSFTTEFTVPVGVDSFVIPVDVLDDSLIESDEFFQLSIISLLNASIADGTGRITIVDDDHTNSAPYFITSPVLRHTVSGLPSAPTGEVWPRQLLIELGEGEQWKGEVTSTVLDIRPGFDRPTGPKDLLTVYASNDIERLSEVLLGDGESGVSINTADSQLRSYYQVPPTIGPIQDYQIPLSGSVNIPVDVTWPSRPGVEIALDVIITNAQNGTSESISFEDLPPEFILDADEWSLLDYEDGYYFLTFQAADQSERVTYATRSALLTYGDPDNEPPQVPAPYEDVPHGTSGIFVNNSNTYGMSDYGIVLTTGSVNDYGTAERNLDGFTTFWDWPGDDPNDIESELLDTVVGINSFNSNGPGDWRDTSLFKLSFDVDETVDRVYFDVVFGTEEFPDYTTQYLIDNGDTSRIDSGGDASKFLDGFGMFVNGSEVGDNIAFASSDVSLIEQYHSLYPGYDPDDESYTSWPIAANIDHPEIRFDTGERYPEYDPDNPGRPDPRLTGTRLNGVLAPQNDPVLRFFADVVPGSTGNELTFVIGDNSDALVDTTIYISRLSGWSPHDREVNLTATEPAIPFENLSGSLLGTPGKEVVFDARIGGTGSSHAFDLQVSDVATGRLIGNLPVTLNDGYIYPSLAVDPDGDKLTYSLPVKPGAAFIDPDTGRIEWIPTIEDIESERTSPTQTEFIFDFVARAEDENSFADQAFSVTVTVRDNAAPVIEMVPNQETVVGSDHLHAIIAHDADGDNISFYLTEGPAGASIDAVSGQFQWKSTYSQVNEIFPVVITAFDGHGGIDQVSFTVKAIPAANNSNPYFGAQPVGPHIVVPELPAIGAVAPLQIHAELPPGETLQQTTSAGLFSQNFNEFIPEVVPDSLVVYDEADEQRLLHALLAGGNNGIDITSTSVSVNRHESLSPSLQELDNVQTTVGQSLQIPFGLTHGSHAVYLTAVDHSSHSKGLRADPSTESILWEDIPARYNNQHHIVTLYSSDVLGNWVSVTFVITVGAPDTDAPTIPEDSQYPGPFGSSSTGVFVNDTAIYDLPGHGVVLSTGNVTDYGGGPNTTFKFSGQYGEPATHDQASFLDQITGPLYHYDVTELVVNFDLLPSDPSTGLVLDTLYFDVVFGSEEFPEFVDSGFIDGFGIFFNEEEMTPVNYAMTDQDELRAHPINIRHPSFEPVEGTELDGILKYDGASVLTFAIPVTPGSENNTLRIILADTSDLIYDTTVYIANLSATPFNGVTVRTELSDESVGVSLASVPARVNAEFGDFVDFTAELRSDGRAASLYVNYIDDATGNLLGAIPVTLNNGFSFYATAHDPNLDRVIHALADTNAPGEVSVNPDNGLIFWSPDLSRLDELPKNSLDQPVASFTIHAYDQRGGEAAETFSIAVDYAAANNQSPVISSNPPAQAQVQEDYLYQVIATDPEANPLRYYISEYPLGMTIDELTGELRWSPGIVFAETTQWVTLTVLDRISAPTTVRFPIEVSPPAFGLNEPPVITSVPPASAIVETSLRYDVTAFDPDGLDHTLTYQLLFGPSGAAFVPDSNQLVWKPTVSQLGQTEQFGIIVTDVHGASDIQKFQVTVFDQNTAPVLTWSDDMTSVANFNWTSLVTASDINRDALTFAVSGDDGFDIDSATGLLTSTARQPGTYPFTISVTDTYGAADSQDYALSIYANRAPVITSVPPTEVIAGEIYRYTVGYIDPDGDEVELIFDENASTASHAVVHTPQLKGATFEWTTESTDLGAVYHVELMVTDRFGMSTVQPFEIRVVESLSDASGNLPPQFTSSPSGPLTTNTLWSYTLSATDPDGLDSSLVFDFDLAAAPAGTEFDAASRTISWTPDSGFSGSQVRMSASVDDGTNVVSQIFVLAVDWNQPPVFLSAPPNEAIIGEEFTYLIIVADPNDDEVTLSINEEASDLGVELAGGVLFWKPTQYTPAHVVLTATDGQKSTTQEFVIGVTNSNSPPQFTSEPPLYTPEDSIWWYALSARDPDNQEIRYSVISDFDVQLLPHPDDPEGIPYILYMDVPDFPDTELPKKIQITAVASDTLGATDTQTFEVTVVASDGTSSPPVITSAPVGPAWVGEEWTYQILATAEEAIVYSFISAPLQTSGMTISTDGLVTWTPTVPGNYWVQVWVGAGNNGVSHGFLLPVETKNSPPKIFSVPYDPVYVGATWTYQILADDPDGDLLTYTLREAPDGFTIDENNIVSFTPEADAVGLQTITIVVEDGNGGEWLEEIDIEVRLPEDAEQFESGQPVILSVPSNAAFLGQTWNYQLLAMDPDPLQAPDGTPIETDFRYYVGAGNEVIGLTVNPVTGLVSYTPKESQVGKLLTGVVLVEERINGEPGGQTFFKFPLRVLQVNQAPVIQSLPENQAYAGTPWSYPLTVEDPESDQLHYALDPASILEGFQLVDDTDRPGEGQKKIIWQPDDSYTVTDSRPVSGHSVHLTVYDRDINTAYDPIEQTNDFSVIGIARQAFTVTVGNPQFPAADGGPSIVSLPNITAELQSQYSYKVKVGPGTNDFVPEVSYHVISGPASHQVGVTQTLEIDPMSGLVEWVATSVGHHTVGIEIRSVDGDVLDQQWFILSAVEPEGANEAPVITSPNLPDGFRNVEYSHDIQVFDANDHEVLFSLEDEPDGLVIDKQTGRLSWDNPDWSPLVGSARTLEFTVVVRETDTFDRLEARRTFELTIAENAPPVITSVPPRRIDWRQSTGLDYLVTAVDPNPGSNVVLSALQLPESAVAFQGNDVVQWSPTGDQLGWHTFSILASDGDADTIQTFDVQVVDGQLNHPPAMLNQLRTTAPAEYEFRHYVIASDLESDELRYELIAGPNGTVPAGMQIDSATGIISWKPEASQIGLHQFSLRITDIPGGPVPRNAAASTYVMQIEVTADLVNKAPLITEKPKGSATWNYEYTFHPSIHGDTDGPPLTDEDNDPVFWTLLESPAGMQVDVATGQISWFPTAEHKTGIYDVVLLAADPYGGTDTKTWSVTLREENLAPTLLTPTAVNVPFNSHSFTWKIHAHDIDENDLVFQRVDSGQDALHVGQDGLVTLNASTLDPITATVQVDDGRGGTDTDTIQFLPYDPALNSPPLVSGTGAIWNVQIGGTSTLEISVDDLAPNATPSQDLQLNLITEYDGLSLSHVTSGPAGRAHLSWTSPQLPEGFHAIEFSVTDAAFPTLTTYVVQNSFVRTNSLPVLEDLENISVVAGQTRKIQAVATDADRDPLHWTISITDSSGAVVNGSWYSISGEGLIRLDTPVDLAQGVYTVAVSVGDIFADTATKSFILLVGEDTEAPTATVRLSSDPASLNEPLNISVSATDNVGVVSLVASYRKKGAAALVDLDLDFFGKSTVTLTEIGEYEVFVIATDAAGNVSTQDSVLDFHVVDRPPIVELFSPSLNSVIKEPTDIVGTIQDRESLSSEVSYRVTLRHQQGGDTIIISDTTGEVDHGVLGTIDTTLLDNGLYILTVEASDGDGNSTIVDRAIEIDGRLKLGNFNLGFTDLQIQTVGIPLTVSRTYDTLQSDRHLDFGYGWQLDLGRPELEVTYPSNKLTNFEGNFVPFRDGTRVSIRLPDGTTDGFTFATTLKINNGYGLPWGETGYVPYFIPDVGARTKLYLAEEIVLTKADDEYLYQQRPFNPTVINSQIDFRLVMFNERVIGIDAVSGDSYIEDRNENRVTISDSGNVTTMTHSDGKQIRIYRDGSYGNRISTIEDPAGNIISYEYNNAGELSQVIDRVENFKADQDPSYVPSAVEIEYWDDPDYPHYLDRIVDQVGREITEVTYDPDQDGRIVQLKDAADATIDLNHSVSEKTQSTVDSTGREVQILRDTDGNVVKSQEVVRDGQGNVTGFTDVVLQQHNDRGNLTYEQIVVGEIDSNDDSDPKDLIRQYQYTSYGAPTLVEDIRGNQTINSYDKYGSLISTIDPLDNVVVNRFDSNGNLTETDDGQRATRITYASSGQVYQVFDDDNPDLALVTNEYFKSGPNKGMLESSTDLNGNTTTFGYDANGNQNLVTRTVGEGNESVRVEDHTTYDPNGRVVSSSRKKFAQNENGDEFLRNSTSSSTSYNLLGQIEYTIDNNGLRSESVYDQRGLVIQTRNEVKGDKFDEVLQDYVQSTDWLVSRTVYDAFGRAIVSTDSYIEGTSTPVSGRHTVYNAKGQVEKSYQLDNVSIQIIDDSGATYATDATFTESMVLHAEWNGLHDASTNPGGATVLSSTTTQYDDQERVEWTEDRYGRRTENSYNQFGEVVETRRQSQDYDPDTEAYTDVWIVSRTVYDEFGRSIANTDEFLMSQDLSTVLTQNVQGSRTVYDSRGRVETTQRVNELDIWIDPVTGDSRIKSVGSLISSSTTTFNQKGQTGASTQTIVGTDGQSDQTTTTNYEYDELGRQTATIGPAVPLTDLELSPPSNAAAVRLRSETIYNDLGQVEKERTNIHQYVIDGSTDPIIDEAFVQESTLEYDSEGRLEKRIFADGTFTLTTYDSEGQVETETNQLGLTRSFGYDDFGRQTSVTLPQVNDPLNGGVPSNPVYNYRYDAFGNLIEITDPLGRDTLFSFNEDSQQQTRTLPLGLGADGMLGTADDSSVPADHFTEKSQYDERGRQKLHTSFEGVVTEFIYDDDSALATDVPDTGRLYQKRFYLDQNAYNAGTVSEIITMTYDAFGRERSTVWDRLAAVPGTVVDTWINSYDDLGRLVSVLSPTDEVHYDYDSSGRQIRVATQPNGFAAIDDTDVSSDIRYTYDLLGRLESVQTWERNNELVGTDVAQTGQQPETESYVYDVLGNLDREFNPDGTTTDYSFDNLNRLTEIVETRSDGTLLSKYNYTLRNDGKRDFSDEKIYSDDGSLASHTTYDWDYDAVGRLTDEIFTNVDGLFFDIDDYHTSFEYDLTGNRLSRTTITDTDNDGIFNALSDQTSQTMYAQDANDRITSETTFVDGSETTSTAYGYDHTQQTSKQVFSSDGFPNQKVSEQRFAYNVQGRLAEAVTETFEFGTVRSRARVDYRYGSDGIRFHATEYTDSTLDPNTENWQLTTETEYLIDARNHTGYQQVLEETVTDADGNLIRNVVYTMGHDHISQTTFGPGEPVAGTTLVFHMDGHGSTRILTDLADSIANLAAQQIFHYTAYGNAINFSMSEAATQYLYSGEQFDSQVGQQYLRARYYNQANGTFNRLDPFFGNTTDPQSFHKYLYTHADPVNGTDPTGLMTLPSMLSSIRIQAQSFAQRGTAYAAAFGGAVGTFGNHLGMRAQQFAGTVMNMVRGLQVLATDTRVVTTFRNTIDYVARLANNRTVMVEVKFALPRSGAAVTRLANQMRAMYERVLTEGAAGQAYHNIVWSMQRPSTQQLTTIRNKVGDTVFNNTQFVDGINGLWIYLDYLTRVTLP